MMRSALLLLSLFLALSSSAQVNNMPADSSLTDSPLGNSVKVFIKGIGDNAEIYNGREYLFAPKAYKGDPYFGDTILFRPAVIKYNGTWYKDISTLYDSYQGVLAVLRPINQAIFMLKDSLVSEFYLHDRHFYHISKPDSAGVLKKGFYEDNYHGKSTVLTQYYKVRSEEAVQPRVLVTFKSERNYYIIKDRQAHRVNGKSSVLNVFKDKKAELNSYIKKNKIEFDDNRINAIVKLTSYYDQLSQ